MNRLSTHILLCMIMGWSLVVAYSSASAQTYTMGTAPAANGSSITTCSGTFYDSGGPTGSYGNGQNVTVTFCSGSPTQNMRLTFNALDLDQNDVLTVYNGNSVAAPQIYQCAGCNVINPLVVSATGSCLTVRFTSNNNNVNTGWVAAISCFTAITNDNCSGATALTVGTACNNVVATNVGATATAGVPAPTCSVYNGGDIWYSFVAPASGALAINTNSIAGGPTDMAMALYSGTCGSLTQIACDDDTGPGFMPLLNSTGLIAGQTYYLRLWEYGNDVFGNFNLCLVESGSEGSNVDCNSSSQLCSDSQVSGASSGFGTQELNTANDGCLGVEHQSNWFYTQVTTAGVFSFTINPQVATDDYDFAVWQYPAGTSVPCPPTAAPTRCSFSGLDGPTGLGNGATDNSENALGNAWVAPINVSVGDILVLLIDNFSSTTSPFTLDFTGTSSLNCNPIPLECSFSGNLQACVGSTSQLTGTGLPAAANPWVSSNTAIATVSNTGLVTAVAAGTVTITYTNSEGCQAIQVFTVNPRPVVSNINLQLCSGTPFSVTPSSDSPNLIPLGTTYSWSAPIGSGFSGGASGVGNSITGTLTNIGTTTVLATYAVSATSGIAPNVCTGQFNLTVAVQPIPNASVAAVSPICLGGTAVFTITGAAGALVTYNLNGGFNTTTALVGGIATISVPGATTAQVLNLVSISSGGSPSCVRNLNVSAAVAVSGEIVPEFNYTNSTYCEGSIVIQPILNTTSLNGITGSWSPSSLSTTEVGITDYVFTPNPGQCATAFSFLAVVAPTPVTSLIFHE